MTSPDESVPLNAVHMPLNMDPETAIYVGMLEGTIAALCINDCKQRTLLELLTGDGWEAARVDFNGQALINLATSALVKQTGMDFVKAKVLVAQRWHERNHPADYIVPQAVSVDSYVGSNLPTSGQVKVDLSERVKTWRARQLADAAKIAQSDIDAATNESVSDSKSQNESVAVSTDESSQKTGTSVP